MIHSRFVGEVISTFRSNVFSSFTKCARAILYSFVKPLALALNVQFRIQTASPLICMLLENNSSLLSVLFLAFLCSTTVDILRRPRLKTAIKIKLIVNYCTKLQSYKIVLRLKSNYVNDCLISCKNSYNFLNHPHVFDFKHISSYKRVKRIAKKFLRFV